MWITGKTQQIPKIEPEKKSFGGIFSFSKCHIIGLDIDVVLFRKCFEIYRNLSFRNFSKNSKKIIIIS
jgi:hypothetical protein